jgi:quinol monooxygenase YgiN
MPIQDRVVSVHPYFKVRPENIEAFKALCERFVDLASKEPKCLYYGFSFDGDEAHCREAYEDAEGVLAHMQNVAHLVAEVSKLAEITRFEAHGVEEELAKLREPLAALNLKYFTLECGVRR